MDRSVRGVSPSGSDRGRPTHPSLGDKDGHRGEVGGRAHSHSQKQDRERSSGYGILHRDSIVAGGRAEKLSSNLPLTS